MKKIIIPFFCMALFSTANAQKRTSPSPAAVNSEASQSKMSADKVINNYLTALGGKEKLEAVKTTLIENTISVQGMEVNSTTMKMGNKFKSVQEVMGQKMVQFFDGEKGYFDQMGAKTEIPADKIPDLKKSKVIDALGYNAANFQSVNEEKIDGKNYYVLTSDKGKFYFDAATGLLYKSETKVTEKGAITEATATVKSYMTVDGLKFPELLEAEGNGQQISIKTTKVTLNSGVSEADFK